MDQTFEKTNEKKKGKGEMRTRGLETEARVYFVLRRGGSERIIEER